MFDLLKWSAEYEPFDMGSWSPDFLLTGKPQSMGDDFTYVPSLLVEVKPITDFDEETAEKMATAALSKPNAEDGFAPSMLLLGVKPQWGRGALSPVLFGWHSEQKLPGGEITWNPAPLGWCSDLDVPKIEPDLLAINRHGYGGLLTDVCGPGTNEHLRYQEHTTRLWAQATNAAQWRGGDAER